MAIIHDISQSERTIIENTPDSVRKLEDVHTVHKKLIIELESDKKIFFEKLPTKIQEKEKTLEKVKKNQTKTNRNFDRKIKTLEKKKSQGILQSISSHLQIGVIKYYSKPTELRKLQSLEERHQASLSKMKNNPQGLFNEEYEEPREEIERFENVKKSPEYAGARGEVRVLEKLSHLSDDYHVFCDIQIGLDYFVTYRGRKNLRSAQMDFVVVSTRGVVMIEVKNWSTEYFQQNRNLIRKDPPLFWELIWTC